MAGNCDCIVRKKLETAAVDTIIIFGLDDVGFNVDSFNDVDNDNVDDKFGLFDIGLAPGLTNGSEELIWEAPSLMNIVLDEEDDDNVFVMVLNDVLSDGFKEVFKVVSKGLTDCFKELVEVFVVNSVSWFTVVVSLAKLGLMLVDCFNDKAAEVLGVMNKVVIETVMDWGLIPDVPKLEIKVFILVGFVVDVL